MKRHLLPITSVLSKVPVSQSYLCSGIIELLAAVKTNNKQKQKAHTRTGMSAHA